jgi:hypothetical protein
MMTLYILLLIALIVGFIFYLAWCKDAENWNGSITYFLTLLFYIIVFTHATSQREFDIVSTGHPVKLVANPETKDLYIQIIELPDRNVNIGPGSGYSGSLIWGADVTFSQKVYRPGWYGLLWFNEFTTYTKDKS